MLRIEPKEFAFAGSQLDRLLDRFPVEFDEECSRHGSA
jgi:hypothetical protein